MEQRHDSLVAAVSDIQHQFAAGSSFTAPTPLHFVEPTFASSSPLLAVKPPKLHLQPFDGFASLDWIFQAEQFFAFYQVPPPQRLDMVSFYMKGEALSWFKWMFINRQLTSWDVFLRALELRFGPSTFDNHQAVLFKLRQRGTVAEFQAKFEHVCNRVVGLPPEAILNCFLSAVPCRCFRHDFTPHSLHSGYDAGYIVSVLIDSSSSHNNIQPRMTAFLGLPVSPLASFPFDHNGTMVTLTGVPSSTPQYASFAHVCRFLTTDAIDSFCLLSVQTASNLSPDIPPPRLPETAPCHPNIAALLEQYAAVFSIPRGLPPHRPQDHHIHLLPNQPPVNIKPYRYPHFQKEIMSQIIQDMLQDGIIKPSTSPFHHLFCLLGRMSPGGSVLTTAP
ncbi:UNVERIFIED_CONTAM: hypothetical protein Sradi_4058000 [Sesamum radiatum]|uniref:Retrotransposon gag domain-containing protein n=1 Tax=Sesamum radiatum TaxID=300843 RepID=A0AAW2PNL6_SESRA